MADSALLEQIRRIVRPLAIALRNTVSRGVIQLVNDGKKLQIVQLGALDGEDIDDAEHFQPYGFTAVPLAGAEAVVLFPGGDRTHGLVVAVSDRRHRPTGAEPGEVIVYNDAGARVKLTKDGDVEITPAEGRRVYIREEGGTVDRLVKKSEFDGHTHGPGTFTTPSAGGGGGPVTGVSDGAAAVTGTETLRAQ